MKSRTTPELKHWTKCGPILRYVSQYESQELAFDTWRTWPSSVHSCIERSMESIPTLSCSTPYPSLRWGSRKEIKKIHSIIINVHLFYYFCGSFWKQREKNKSLIMCWSSAVTAGPVLDQCIERTLTLLLLTYRIGFLKNLFRV